MYERRCNEPPGTRPLENLLQRLFKDGHFPDRLDAYATTVRKLGNVGTHTFGEKITAQDVYQSLTQLMPILEWYFEVERPEALSQKPKQTPRPAPSKPPPPARKEAPPKVKRAEKQTNTQAALPVKPTTVLPLDLQRPTSPKKGGENLGTIWVLFGTAAAVRTRSGH